MMSLMKLKCLFLVHLQQAMRSDDEIGTQMTGLSRIRKYALVRKPGIFLDLGFF